MFPLTDRVPFWNSGFLSHGHSSNMKQRRLPGGQPGAKGRAGAGPAAATGWGGARLSPEGRNETRASAGKTQSKGSCFGEWLFYVLPSSLKGGGFGERLF